MALNIISLLLVLGIAFMHSMFGLFSGLINVFCCVLAAAVALGFYDALNYFVTEALELHSAYTEPACLIGLFAVTLTALRLAADNYIRGNVHLPMYVDWGGGAVCGFLIGQICIGMLVIGVLMLPVGGRVLQFSRYERVEGESDPDHAGLARFDRRSLWTRPDEMTVGLFDHLSGGALRGGTAFAAVYPDFLDAVFFSTNTVQAESSPAPLRDKKGGDGFKKGIAVEQWWEQPPGKLEVRYRKDVPTEKKTQPGYERTTFEAAPGKKLIGVRAKLLQAAADRDSKKRATRHLFRPTMLRLVGVLKSEGGAERPVQYVARVLNTGDPALERANRLVDMDNNFSLPGEDQEIDVYFEVDAGFQPSFLEYRRHARVPLDAGKLKAGPAGTLVQRAEEPSQAGSTSGSRTFGQVLLPGSGANKRLPFDMLATALRSQGDITLKDNGIAKGRLSGNRSRLERQSANDPVVADFYVPENKRLCQVRYRPKQALTLVGQVFNFVGQINQYQAVDQNGNLYPMVGYYAIVQRGREQFIELFYNGDPDGEPFDPGYKSMLDFKSIDRNEINEPDTSEVCLLFLVKPEVKIVRIENQGRDGGDVQFSMP